MNPIKHTVEGREYELRSIQNQKTVEVAIFRDGKRIPSRVYSAPIDTSEDFKHSTGQNIVDLLIEEAKKDLDSGKVK
jgi:hypothetical protein